MAALVLFASAGFGQQGRGSLRGVVADEFGASIVGATVTLMDAAGTAKTATTNSDGVYTFTNLAPGKYTVVAVATGFALSEGVEVDITAGQRQSLNLPLKVTIEQQQVTVAAEQPISTEPANNANQQVLTGKDLDALPDDPDELAAALQALAGPSMGPNGGTITIDGFGGGRMPPKESIREIRINQNPFAAENDRPSGGINILTKPGTDKFRGSANFSFQDESLNSRNPFATSSPKRAPYQVRQFGGNLSGPIIKNKSSFFFDLERRETDDNELVNATILSGLNIVPFGLGVVVPKRVITFSPRVDYALNDKNTLIARYSFNHSTTANDGVGNFSLPERAYNSNFTQHQVQLTETAVLSPTVINETRFQFVNQRNESLGNNSQPTINVSSAFISGGSQVGHVQIEESRWELQNFTQWQKGTHNIKFGGRIRGVNITNINPNNFGGTYSFNGGYVPLLDANDNVVLDANGNRIPVLVTSIERYRRTVKFQRLGLTGQAIHALGGGASQFNINAGDPEASVSQTDLGIYGQDDWRVKPNLTLSVGLRYEGQTNIGSKFNFAPRLAVSWSPGAGNSAKPPKTVVRAGAGVFYNRFGENFTLTANRFNGVNQQQFQLSEQSLFVQVQPGQPGCPSSATAPCLVYQNPAASPFLDVPSSATPPLSALVASGRVTTYRVSPDLQAPTLYLGGAQVEHQLPYRITMFVGVFSINMQHVIRARDINAPLPGTITPTTQAGIRPNPTLGDIYQYESSGRFRQTQFFVGFNNRLNPSISLNGNYVYSRTSNDTDGGGGFPANSYDLTGEYGRGTGDVRHRLTLNGTINVPWGKVVLNPFVIASSGAPFNIYSGLDSNLDRQLTERPSFAASGASCLSPNIRCTAFGNFNLTPLPGEQIIPRNYGQGPGFLSVNMRVSRTWAFGDVHRAGSAAASGQGPNRRGGAATGGGGEGRGGPGGPGGMAGMGGMGQRGGGGIPGLGPGGLGGGGGGAEKKYSLTLSLNFQNLLNNVNFNAPNGNLSSPSFGQSLGLNGGFGGFGGPGGGGGGGGGAGAGNRKVTAQIRFTF